MGTGENVNWKELIQRRVERPNELDGMRNAFRTTLDRQEEHREHISDLEARRDRAREVKLRSASDPRLLEKGIERLRENRIKVLGPFTAGEARKAVLAELGGERLIVKSKSNVTKEIELTHFLEGNGVEVIETDAGDRIIQIAGEKPAHPTGPAADLTRYQIAKILSKHFGKSIEPDPDVLTQVIREDVRRSIERSDIGITGANVITVEEGSVVIVHNEGNAAECARRPGKHIIVASIDKFVPNLDEAINLVKLQTYYAIGKLAPIYVNIISGPSMTADIEKKAFYGMHGPKEVVLVLVDGGRSAAADKENAICTNCGSCLLRCPVYDVLGKEYGGPCYLGGKGIVFTSLLRPGESSEKTGLALCTNCGVCQEMCPVRIDTPRLMKEERAIAFRAHRLGVDEHEALAKSIRNYRNPWLQPRSARARWAKDLGLGTEGKVLFFAGCSTSLLDPTICVDAIELLRRGGIEPSYLGKDETCCGSTLARIGQEELFGEVARDNIRRILASGAERIITTCPGCFVTIRGYASVDPGFSIPVEHISVTLARLAAEGKLRFRPSSEKVAYHDPCDLGRHGGVFDEPRELLRSIPGLQVQEIATNRNMAACCGSGGGVKTAYPRLAEAIGGKRLDEVARTGANLLVTACPWCEANFRDAQRVGERRLVVQDIVHFARQNLA